MKCSIYIDIEADINLPDDLVQQRASAFFFFEIENYHKLPLMMSCIVSIAIKHHLICSRI